MTLDNRRLFCFRSIGLPNLKIPVVVLSYEESNELWKLTTVNNGGLPVVRVRRRKSR